MPLGGENDRLSPTTAFLYQPLRRAERGEAVLELVAPHQLAIPSMTPFHPSLKFEICPCEKCPTGHTAHRTFRPSSKRAPFHNQQLSLVQQYLQYRRSSSLQNHGILHLQGRPPSFLGPLGRSRRIEAQCFQPTKPTAYPYPEPPAMDTANPLQARGDPSTHGPSHARPSPRSQQCHCPTGIGSTTRRGRRQQQQHGSTEAKVRQGNQGRRRTPVHPETDSSHETTDPTATTATRTPRKETSFSERTRAKVSGTTNL